MKHILQSIIFIVCTILFNLSAYAQWQQIGQDIDGETSNDFSGCSVSLSSDGSRVAIGAQSNAGNGNNAGHVRIYDWNGSSWVQIGQDIDGEAADDYSGSSVSLSSDGSRVAIGASLNDGNGINSGHVRIYDWNGSSWIQVGQDIDGEAAGDKSGYSVSLSSDGSRVAISAQWNANQAGHVRIYEWNGSSWVQVGQDIDGEAADDSSGSSVSLSSDGSRVAVGASLHEGNVNPAGHVRIYDWDGLSWVQVGQDIDGEAPGDQSGESVSLSSDGSRIAIGARANDGNGSNSGHVRIYDWNGSSWVQVGQDIDGESADNYSGRSVSLSSDGSRVAIGAPINNGNGYFAGHVRIYDWDGSSWVQVGQDIDGEAAENQSGYAVPLSSDGSRIAIGAPFNNGNGSIAGHVRIYDLAGVSGLVYQDINENCVQDSFEQGVPGVTLEIQPGNQIVTTNSSGTWSIDSLPQGNYSATVLNSGVWIPSCNPSTSFTVTNPEGYTQVNALQVYSLSSCAFPDVSIHAPRLRRCFSNQRIFVNASNALTATDFIGNAYVEILLDTAFTLDNASLPFTALGGNRFRFDIGDLYPGQSVDFTLSTTVSCNTVLNQTLCMQASLLPLDSCTLDTILPSRPLLAVGGGGGVFEGIPQPCTLPYDGSSLVVSGGCQNDTVEFTVFNTSSAGQGDMQCFSPVHVYEDGVLVYTDSIQLQGGQSTSYSFPGSGETWIMEVGPHPLQPGNPFPTAFVELCGGTTIINPGLVNQFPTDDGDAHIDIYCGEVTGSYDPNDKIGYPTGQTANNYIYANQQIQYRIRFQNTGNDTAFTVVIRDTLSENLSISSVQSGVSSHDYTFRMYGPRVLEWTFNNILLPDSFTNEPESNGFVLFTVDQVTDLAVGEVIENAADIYFDFNEPIRTNTTRHEIFDGFPEVTRIEHQELPSRFVMLYPNPAQHYFRLQSNTEESLHYRLINVQGQEVLSGYHTGYESEVGLEGIPTGMYTIFFDQGYRSQQVYIQGGE